MCHGDRVPDFGTTFFFFLILFSNDPAFWCIIYFLKRWQDKTRNITQRVWQRQKKLLPFLRQRQAWLAHKDIREHGGYGSPATIHQAPKWLPWHHHYSFSSGPYVATTSRKEAWGGGARTASAFWRKGQRSLALIGQRIPLSISCGWDFLTKAHSLLHPSHIYARPHSSHSPPYLRLSLLSPPPPPSPFSSPSRLFRVLRPESNLQQLSKSGMTDKLIFSSWVYIPGIWAADLAPNKRGVSASCLLKLMFSWPEMNYPVTRIYLYSS